MVEINWTGAALRDLDAIAEYIAVDKPEAAAALVRRVVEHVDKLKTHPQLGPAIPELRPNNRFRQIVEPPCRVFYRHDISKDICHILHVTRGEKLFQKRLLLRRDVQ
jgi:toxin ParE1/3/4